MNTEKLDEILKTAGQLAAQLGRSTYGVKKALWKMGVKPVLTLNGTSYYDGPSAIARLQEAMRSPNKKPAA